MQAQLCTAGLADLAPGQSQSPAPGCSLTAGLDNQDLTPASKPCSMDSYQVPNREQLWARFACDLVPRL